MACHQHAPGIADYENLEVEKSTHWKAYHQYLLGEHASHHGHIDQAMGFFKNANALNGARTIDYRMAYESAQQGKLDQALDLLDGVLDDNPYFFHARLLRAKVHAAQSDYGKSKRDFQHALDHPLMQELSTEKIKTQLALVTLYIESKDFKPALQLLDAMGEEDAGNELVSYYKARVATEKGNLKQALALYETTIEINPDFILAYRAMALMHEYFGHQHKKMAALEHIVRIDPSDIRTRTLLIHYHLEANRFDLAGKHELYFRNRFEQDIRFCFELGLFYMQQKMFGQATDTFSRCKVLYPDNDQVTYYKGLNLYYVKKFDDAMGVFSSIDIPSAFYEKSILARTSILREQERNKEAVVLFEQGMRSKPLAHELPLHFARYQMQVDNHHKAKSIIQKALKKFTSQFEPFSLLLAEIYEREKEYTLMEDVLMSILAKNQSSASALNFLGYSYIDRNIHMEKGEKMILDALELKPTDGYIQDSLAWVYYRKGQYQKALKVIEMALQLVPNEWVLWDHYGDILLKLNQPQDARKAYQRALVLTKDDQEKQKLKSKINPPSV